MTATLDERPRHYRCRVSSRPRSATPSSGPCGTTCSPGGRRSRRTKRKGCARPRSKIHGRNYAPLLALHWGLTPTVTGLLGLDLLPSFVFFRLYFEGDVLRVHSDRPACEVSLSLTLASNDSLPWPLSVGTAPANESRGVEDDFGNEPYDSFAMNAGDGLLYRGTERRHGRLEPNPNRWSAHVFFMWVHAAGEHRNEAFERLDLGAAPSF